MTGTARELHARRACRFITGLLLVAFLLTPATALADAAATIEGPLGTTVITPPLQLGAPGQPSPVVGLKASAAGISVSVAPASAAPGPAASPSPSSPGQLNEPASASPGARVKPRAAVKDDPPEARQADSGGRTRGRSGSERSRAGRSPVREGAATPAGRSRAGQPAPVAARSEPSRPSVAQRIADQLPTGYWLALLVAAALACGFAVATMRERRRARRAEAEALVDPLTGLANRRAFDRRLEEEWKRSERYGHPLGLVMLDLDGFKRLNDSRGHKEGDRVLREAASLIADRLRAVDLAARLGGDEFAALCPETSSEGLDALSRSLRRCLENLPVGASIGYAEREPGDEAPGDLFARADAAMYREKRDTVEHLVAVR